jgi:PAS domain S-box-containing protein
VSLVEDPEIARSIFREAIDAYLLIDPADLRVLDANPAALRLTGYRRKEVLQLRMADLFDGPDDGPAQALLEGVQSTSRAGVFEGYWLRGAGGKRVPVQVTASRVHAEPATLGLLIVRDLTARRELEPLLESKRFIDRVAEASPHIIYVFDLPSRKNIYANRLIARDLGYSPDEVQAMGDEFLPRLLHPDDLARLPELLRRWDGARDGEVFETHYRMRHRDGSWRWFVGRDTVFSRGPDGRVTRFLGTAEDVTDRKHAEEALRASERRYLTTLASIGDAVVATDAAGRVTYLNPVAEALTGWPLAEAVGRPLDEALPLRDERTRQPVENPADQALRLRAAVGLANGVVLVTRDGREVPIEDSAAPIRGDDGEVHGVVLVFRDVTARRQAEEQRRRLEAQLLHAQKLESLGVLAGGIAHDFNNLLTGILGYTNLAGMSLPADSTARPLLGEAERTANRASDLVRQLLAYAGKGRFLIQPIDLNALTGEMLGLLRTLVSHKAHVRTDFADGLPPVQADAAQLRQVVLNLITNASEALGGAEGEITLRTGVERIDDPRGYSPHAAPEAAPGEYVFVEVADTGCGMSEEMLARVFDPFFSTKFSGRGLGLAAVLGIVRGHRGLVRLSSAVGQGTRFRVLFPRAKGALPELAPAEARPPGPAAGTGSVLVVDDEEAVRSLAAHVLREAGYQVIVAGDGEEGLAAFRVAGSTIRAVLMDLTMPGLDGVEATRRLYELRADLPVVLMSGYGEPQVMAGLAGMRFAGFLQKPFIAEGMLAALRAALERSG